MSSPQHVTDEQITAWNRQLQADPEYQRLMQIVSATDKGTSKAGAPLGGQPYRDAANAAHQYLLSKGIDPGQTGTTINRQGAIVRDHFYRDVALATGSMLGGGYVAGALMGPSAILGPTGAAASITPAVPPALAPAAATGVTMGRILQQVAQAGIPIGTMAATRAASGGTQDPSAMSPELQQLLGMALKRMQDQQPLQDAVNKQAFEGLPAYAKAGR